MTLAAEVVIVDCGLHIDKVDNSAEIFLGAYRKLNCHCIGLQTLLHHFYNLIEIGAHNIHLIYIDKSRNIIVVCLPPDRF